MEEAAFKEFGVLPSQNKPNPTSKYFLLYEDNTLKASGVLIDVKPIEFNREQFSIFGICGIIALEKGRGYGKQIMEAIKNYLITNHKTGVGFSGLKLRGFYEKCGFKVDTTSFKRFKYLENNEWVSNPDNDIVIYLESNDHFMEKVLKLSDEIIYSPQAPW